MAPQIKVLHRVPTKIDLGKVIQLLGLTQIGNTVVMQVVLEIPREGERGIKPSNGVNTQLDLPAIAHLPSKLTSNPQQNF